MSDMSHIGDDCTYYLSDIGCVTGLHRTDRSVGAGEGPVRDVLLVSSTS